MYDPEPRGFNPLRLIIIMVIAVVIIMGVTVALNGNSSNNEPVENNTTAPPAEVNPIEKSVVVNNSYGVVTKMSGYGNKTSDIHVALIVGVDVKTPASNVVVSTLENSKNLKYAYDIYVIEPTNDTNINNTTNNSNNLTLNNKTEALADESVVPDIISNNYNFSMDIHGVSDSNSFVFVPSEDTYTSKKVVTAISNNTDVGVYTPSSYTYARYVSIPLISNNIPSVVYMTSQYNTNGTSSEIGDVIGAVDNFDFEHLDDSLNNTTTNDTSQNTSNVNSSNNKSSSDSNNSTQTDGNSEIID